MPFLPRFLAVSSLRLALALSALSLALPFSVEAAAVTSSASAFTVSGTLKFGPQTAKMTHLYFRRQKTDDVSSVVVLIFSDHALPAFALEDRSRLAGLARRKTFMGLYAEVDDSGAMKASELYDNDGGISAAWSLEANSSSQAGKISSDGDHDYFDKMYNVELAYSLSSPASEQWGGSETAATKSTGLAAGKAEGWVEQQGKKSSLMYATAVSETDLFGENLQRKIILSTAPVTEAMLNAAPDPEHALNAAGIAFLRLGLDAKANIESVMVPAADGNPVSYSSNLWDLELTPVPAGEFDGVAQTSTPGKDDNPDYPRFNLRFHAAAAKASASSPITAENGSALPKDGGAPGQAYRDYLVALKDAKTIAELLSRRTAQTAELVRTLPETQHAAVLAFMKMEVSSGYKVVGGFSTADRATLSVESSTGPDHLEGRINLSREGGQWRIGLEAFRAPPAGK